MIPCESFACGLKCPICCRMFPHLIEFDYVNFKAGIVLFYATCSNCQRLANMQGETAQPFRYQCDYKYWEEMTPIEDLPNPN